MRAFGRLQIAMIRALTENVRRGGHLVYSVCSFEPEETTQVMEQVWRKTVRLSLRSPFPAFSVQTRSSRPDRKPARTVFLSRS